jgi:REP element-mobilizing transposase RayT
MHNRPQRKSPRLKGFDYSSKGAYYVTIVVQGRDCLFGEIVKGEMRLNGYGEIVQKWWYEIANHFQNVDLGAFVIMPNHVHGIIWITDERRGEVISPRVNPNKNILNENIDGTSNQGGETPPLRKPTLGQIVAYFKYQSTKEMNRIETDKAITKFWQRNYGACPELVEGNTSSAMKKTSKTKPITSKPIPCCGTRTMKTLGTDKRTHDP